MTHELPLDWPAAREVAAGVLGPDYVIREDGYEDDLRFVVPYTERDGPGWDLPVLVIEKATGWTRLIPWFDGYSLPENMRPVML